MILLPLLLLAGLAAEDSSPAAVHDGGVCTGLSWVRLTPSEKAFVERGPDFAVYRFEGPRGSDDHWWGVYSGNSAQVEGNGPVLLRSNGVVVRRAIVGGKFRGYLAEKAGWQNHFFGSVFNGTSTDRRFFDRIDFGPSGRALCAKDRG